MLHEIHKCCVVIFYNVRNYILHCYMQHEIYVAVGFFFTEFELQWVFSTDFYTIELDVSRNIEHMLQREYFLQFYRPMSAPIPYRFLVTLKISGSCQLAHSRPENDKIMEALQVHL